MLGLDYTISAQFWYYLVVADKFPTSGPNMKVGKDAQCRLIEELWCGVWDIPQDPNRKSSIQDISLKYLF